MKINAPRVSILSFLPLLFLISCSDGRAGPTGHTVRDSAEIRIVENTTPRWGAGEGWRLGDTPTLDIGSTGGDPNHQLYRVRGAAGLPDGRIVIANAGTYELRFFSAGGEYLDAAGRHGEGPGELQHLTWMAKGRGDSLFVFDRLQMRISVFDHHGRFQRSVNIRHTENTAYHPIGVFSDASILSYGTPIFHVQGAYREDDLVFRHGPEGERVDTLGAFPGAESFARDLVNGPPMSGTQLFHRSSTYLARGQDLIVATNDSYQIGVYAETGELRALIRRDLTHLPVTEEAVAFERERFVSIRTPHPMRPQLEEFFDAKPIPQTMPAYASVNQDEAGNLWVEEYRYPDDDVARWTLFDTEGVMLGTITMPPGFTLLYAGEDFILGRWEDELGVDHVQRYELMKGY